MAARETATTSNQRSRRRRTGQGEPRARDMTERMNLHARAVAVGILVALIGVGAFGRFYTARFNGLVTPTAMEVGVIAQQLRYNRGFSTRVLYPVALDYAQPDEQYTVPMTGHQPLYPLLLSLLFRVRGGGDASIAMFNGLMFLLTGWLVYAITRGLWDKPVAVLATITYFVSIETISTALKGTGASLAGLLVAIAVWAALRHRAAAQRMVTKENEDAPGARPSIAWLVIVGVSFGLAYLSDSTAALLVIPIAVLAAVPGAGRLRQALVVVVVAALVVSPWLIRNWRVTGTPVPVIAAYQLLADTPTYPSNTIYGQMPGTAPSPLAFVLSHPGDIVNKMGRGLSMLYRGAPGTLTPYLFPFFIIGAFVFGAHDLKRCLWRAVVAMAILQAISISLFSLQLDGIAVIVPLAMCLAVGGLVEVLRRMNAERWQTIAIGTVIVVLVLFPTVASAIIGGKMRPNPSLASLDILNKNLRDDALIASDNPAAVAWYADKPALALPASPEDLETLDGMGIGPDYVYLTAAISGPTFPTGLRPWRELLGDQERVKALGNLLPLPYRELLFERVNKRIPREGAAAGGS